MKHLQESLFDKDLVQKDIMYHPETKAELKNLLKRLIDERGPDANLNDIDVSKITDMSDLFWCVRNNIKNIDISEWDVSNVRIIGCMFMNCKSFNSNLSKWDMSKVIDMRCMFYNCELFNSDLSKWDVSKVKDMYCVFTNCTSFNSDLSKWNVSKVKDMRGMFYGCKSLKKIPEWYHEES